MQVAPLHSRSAAAGVHCSTAQLHAVHAAGQPAGCNDGMCRRLAQLVDAAVLSVVRTAKQIRSSSAHLRQVEAGDQARAVRQAQLDGGHGRRLIGARPPCSGACALLQRRCACCRTTCRRRRRRLRCGWLGRRACRPGATKDCTHAPDVSGTRLVPARWLQRPCCQCCLHQVSQASALHPRCIDHLARVVMSRQGQHAQSHV